MRKTSQLMQIALICHREGRHQTKKHQMQILKVVFYIRIQSILFLLYLTE